MKKIVPVISILLLLSACGTIADKSKLAGNKGSNKAKKSLIYHVNPMPNYMQVIMKYGADLDLNEQQKLTLSNWRNAHKPVMSGLVKSVADHESRLRSMALGDANEDELIDQYAQIEELRSQIALTKIKCRAMMEETLTLEQFEMLQEIYERKLLNKHARAW